MMKMGTETPPYLDKPFVIDPPHIGNQYLEDTFLRELLRFHLPADVLRAIQPDLLRFGQRVVGEVLENGRRAERHNFPVIQATDSWGRRVDNIEVSSEWQRLVNIAAEEGLVSIGYERRQEQYSRVYQFTKLYLYASSAAIADCPLAMTDGAARLCELLSSQCMVDLRRNVLPHFMSRDPSQFWTLGQWMTERPGGSDVGNTETIARIQPDGSYRLYGYKYFTSATTSQVSFGLARIVDPSGTSVAGSPGLSLFYIEVYDHAGALNNIRVVRLKDKLGTRALPTAELELSGTRAYLVGERGRGVPTISVLFNITRVYNASSMVSGARRAVALARDYAHRRHAFGKPLAAHPLHVDTLADMDMQVRGSLAFVLDVAVILGRVECSNSASGDSDDALLLRLLTPLLKLFTAKMAVSVVSEGLECFGGAGYMEDTGLPVLLRNVQVGTIWEGTTNVLALDLLRALSRSPQALRVYMKRVRQIVGTTPIALRESAAAVTSACDAIDAYAQRLPRLTREMVEQDARRFCFSLSRVYIGALFIQIASVGTAEAATVVAAKRWCRQQLVVIDVGAETVADTRVLGLDVDNGGRPRGCGNLGEGGVVRARY